MGAKCCGTPIQAAPGYSRVLWIALAVNAAMFVVEVVAGLFAGSLSLQADALDFLGDAGNYALSLWAASRALPFSTGIRAPWPFSPVRFSGLIERLTASLIR